MKNNLTIIIIAGNEQNMIEDCLISCLFADQIILVPTYTCQDNTVNLSQNIYPKIKIKNAPLPKVDFSYWRNTGIKFANTKWILFVDADERITNELQTEILSVIKTDKYTNYDIPRANYFLGHRVKYGNSYPDYVKRLFLKSKFKGYRGALHEQPLISGASSTLISPFLHFTHRDLSSMLAKSIQWTPLESKLLYDTQHPPIVWWRIVRMMLTKLWERLIKQSMWRDGTVGWISAIFEMFDTYMIYTQLWELQQKHD